MTTIVAEYTIHCVGCHRSFSGDTFDMAKDLFNAHECTREFEPIPEELDYPEQ